MDTPIGVVELRHLRMVVGIVEKGSVTAAARDLGQSQPALSHQLSALERRLRTPLFVRGKRLVPTPAGEQLLSVARSVLGQVSSFERQLAAGTFSQALGTIRLATECYTAFHWLPTVLRRFRERWPGVDLRIAPEYTAAPIAALRDGALDLAVIHHAATDRRIRIEPLFDDELVVVMSPDHPLARRPFVSAQDFENEHLIIYTTTDPSVAVIRDVLAPAGVEPKRLTRIQLTEAILELVAAGLGISVLAGWSIAPALRAGTVRAVRLTEAGYLRRWFVAMRADDLNLPFHTDLVEILRSHLRTGPALLDAARSA